jgi:hypothetical protein
MRLIRPKQTVFLLYPKWILGNEKAQFSRNFPAGGRAATFEEGFEFPWAFGPPIDMKMGCIVRVR